MMKTAPQHLIERDGRPRKNPWIPDCAYRDLQAAITPEYSLPLPYSPVSAFMIEAITSEGCDDKTYYTGLEEERERD